MTNGKYDISPQRWEEMTTDEKLWLIYDTFNGERESVSKRFRMIEVALIVLFTAVFAGADKVPAFLFKLLGM